MSMTAGNRTPPLLLVNPRASRMADPARRADVVDAVSTAIRQRYGTAPRLEDGTLDATRRALAESPDAPVVVVVGGDGTVREAATALLGLPTPLAIVPAGTGNVLAGTIGIRGLRPAIDALRSGRTRVLDVGRATWTAADLDPAAHTDRSPESRVFMVACGMGLDARVMAAAEHAWKRRMRFGAYVGAAFRELLRLETARFRIVADGDLIELEGYLALVANAGELVPGRIGPRRPIDPTDGRLDLIVLGGSNPLAALHGAVLSMVGTGDLDGPVIRRTVREVRIEAEPAQPIETDGDDHPPGILEAEVVPAALTVIVPERR